MAASAGEDEEMPNCVGVLQVFSGIEKRPDGVGESADDQEVKSGSAKRGEQRHDHQHCHPTHGEISKQRKTLEAMDEENLEQNPGKSQKPNSDEKKMRCLAVESDQKQGRVRAGYEKINGAVVATFEKGAGRGMDEAMIKSRRQEDEDEAESIDKNSGKLQGRENGISLDQHQDQARYRGEDADTMNQSTGPFFGGGVGGDDSVMHKKPGNLELTRGNQTEQNVRCF